MQFSFQGYPHLPPINLNPSIYLASSPSSSYPSQFNQKPNSEIDNEKENANVILPSFNQLIDFTSLSSSVTLPRFNQLSTPPLQSTSVTLPSFSQLTRAPSQSFPINLPPISQQIASTEHRLTNPQPQINQQPSSKLIRMRKKRVKAKETSISKKMVKWSDNETMVFIKTIASMPRKINWKEVVTQVNPERTTWSCICKFSRLKKKALDYRVYVLCINNGLINKNLTDIGLKLPPKNMRIISSMPI
jgi:hypothetical protein